MGDLQAVVIECHQKHAKSQLFFEHSSSTPRWQRRSMPLRDTHEGSTLEQHTNLKLSSPNRVKCESKAGRICAFTRQQIQPSTGDKLSLKEYQHMQQHIHQVNIHARVGLSGAGDRRASDGRPDHDNLSRHTPRVIMLSHPYPHGKTRDFAM